jgi:hypothetical protein
MQSNTAHRRLGARVQNIVIHAMSGQACQVACRSPLCQKFRLPMTRRRSCYILRYHGQSAVLWSAPSWRQHVSRLSDKSTGMLGSWYEEKEGSGHEASDLDFLYLNRVWQGSLERLTGYAYDVVRGSSPACASRSN